MHGFCVDRHGKLFILRRHKGHRMTLIYTPAQAKPKPGAPKFEIPTAFAWQLLECNFHGAPLAQLAQISAAGASQIGENETTAFEKYRKYLALQQHVRAPHKDPQAAFMAALKRAVRQKLRTTFHKDIGEAKRIYRHLRSASGPFSALVVDHVVAVPTAAQQALLVLSKRFDRLGAAFSSAYECSSLEDAKAVLLVSDAGDESYWTLPEDNLPDADVNKESLRDAYNWEQLKRVSSPFVLNATLSWLSLLDIAILSAGRHQDADFSLFQPLITQPLEGSNYGPAALADRQRLPVPNLIRLAKAIRDDVNARLQKRPNKPERKHVNKGDNANLANDLKLFKKNGLLSQIQFTAMINKLSPDAQPSDDEGCGFDINSLHIATNLFSLLTPRDGSPPMRKTQRIAPNQVTCLTAIEPVYMRWWATHREQLTEGANPPPRPPWLTALRPETVHPGRGWVV
jgi:hypothetical protein